jgi:hypothetical protein
MSSGGWRVEVRDVVSIGFCGWDPRSQKRDLRHPSVFTDAALGADKNRRSLGFLSQQQRQRGDPLQYLSLLGVAKEGSEAVVHVLLNVAVE